MSTDRREYMWAYMPAWRKRHAERLHKPADPNNWIVPIAKGGPHTTKNTQVSHPSCNCSKGARV